MDSILQESNVIMKSGENYKKFEKSFTSPYIQNNYVWSEDIVSEIYLRHSGKLQNSTSNNIKPK